MALSLIEPLFGHKVAMDVANGAEYEWSSDSHRDPFAKLNGLAK
jgi:hypothetical protein